MYEAFAVSLHGIEQKLDVADRTGNAQESHRHIFPSFRFLEDFHEVELVEKMKEHVNVQTKSHGGYFCLNVPTVQMPLLEEHIAQLWF